MRLRAFWNFLKARNRRRHGFYDKETLRLFASAVRGAGCAHSWFKLGYLQFLRDLGHSLPKSLLMPMLDEVTRMKGRKRRVVLRLIAEFYPQHLPEAMQTSLDARGGLPIRSYVSASAGDVLSTIDSMQQQWRTEFESLIRTGRMGGGICAVGNAGSLRHALHGGAIDQHAVVVRFNNFARDESLITSVGKRLDVWVLSPGYVGPVPVGVQWVVITGPDVRFSLRKWHHLSPLLAAGAKVLTVPLSVWRRSVRQLQAPPSAGVLILEWVRAITGTWGGVAAAGIGEWTGEGVYHLTTRGQLANSRHQWGAEHLLVAQWSKQGLYRLGKADANAGVCL